MELEKAIEEFDGSAEEKVDKLTVELDRLKKENEEKEDLIRDLNAMY